MTDPASTSRDRWSRATTHFLASALSLIDRPRRPPSAIPNAFVVAIDVVELKRGRMLVEPTTRASTAGLLDQCRLDLAAASDDRFDLASGASVAAASKDEELTFAVIPAGARKPGLSSVNRFECAFAIAVPPAQSEPMLGQPMPNRRLAAIELAGDFLQRRASLNQGLQLLAGQATPQRVLGLPVGLEPVLGDPVPDGRRVPIDQRGDLAQGEPTGQPSFEKDPVHVPDSLVQPGRKSEHTCGVCPSLHYPGAPPRTRAALYT